MVTEPVGEEVTAENVSEVVATARTLYAERFDPKVVRFLQEVYEVRDAGLPGIRVRVAFKSPRGVQVEDEITTLFRGEMSYMLTCQNRPDRATEMAAGCVRVFETFRAKR